MSFFGGLADNLGKASDALETAESTVRKFDKSKAKEEPKPEPAIPGGDAAGTVATHVKDGVTKEAGNVMDGLSTIPQNLMHELEEGYHKAVDGIKGIPGAAHKSANEGAQEAATDAAADKLSDTFGSWFNK